MTLQYTGERVIPDQMNPMNGMLLEHIARYQFAAPFLQGRVLDFATGCGFGSQLIAKMRRNDLDEIVAIDLAESAIRYAKGRYYHPNVRYVVGNVLDKTLPQQFGQFDFVISFETIEHVEDYKRFMENAYSLLKPGGVLILSTPFGQGVGKSTKEPFHVHQFTEQEFYSLFTNFSSASFYHQRGVLIEPKREGIHYPIGIAVAAK